jgi:hypothetical protein
MPRSAVEALVKAVPDDVVRGIVGDNYPGIRARSQLSAKAEGEDVRAALARGIVRPVTDVEAIERWRAEPAEVITDYNPFSNDRIRS